MLASSYIGTVMCIQTQVCLVAGTVPVNVTVTLYYKLYMLPKNSQSGKERYMS